MKKRLLAVTLALIIAISALVVPTTAMAASKNPHFNVAYRAINAGSTYKLAFYNAKGGNVTKKTAWSSCNNNVATVNSSGQVRGVGIGITYINAKYAGKLYQCKITVRQNPAKAVKVNRTNANVVLKKSASGSSKNLITIPKNSAVKRLSKKGSWYRVSYTYKSKTYTGYVPTNRIVLKTEYQHIKAKAIKIIPNKTSFRTGETIQYVAVLSPANATERINWSSNSGCVSVNANGLVTSRAVGNPTITAQAGSASASNKIASMINATGKTYISSTSASVYYGDKYDLNLISPYGGYLSDQATWSVSDKALLSVNAHGYVSTHGIGTATVYAKYNNVTYSCVIKVSQRPVENNTKIPITKIELACSKPTLYIGEKAQVVVRITPANATEKITFKSSNSNVKVDKNGVVTSSLVGQSVITASSSKASAQITITSARKYFGEDVKESTSTNAEDRLYIYNAYGNIYNYHPKCIYIEDGFGTEGYKYWLSYSPYPFFNDYYENPHIAVSNDLKEWTTPEGYKNPLEPTPSDHKKNWNYNSDPEMVYNSDLNQLECWWREYHKTTNEVYLYRKYTKDGVNWSNKELLTKMAIGVKDYLSPSIIYEDGVYKIWAVNVDYSVFYTELFINNTTKAKIWKPARVIPISYKIQDLKSWHLSVIHTDKGYEMVLSAFHNGENHLTMNLYYTSSPDNYNYPTAVNILTPSKGTDNWDNYGLYRSSLLYENGQYHLFYSGIYSSPAPSGLGMISGDSPFDLH